jgi:hypothetical protein
MTLLKSNGNLIPFGMDNFFADDFFNNQWLEKKLKHTLPAVNIKENKNEFKIEFASPGFTKKDFKIDLDQDVLCILENLLLSNMRSKIYRITLDHFAIFKVMGLFTEERVSCILHLIPINRG